jgi:phosphatidylglycerophosphate synthase
MSGRLIPLAIDARPRGPHGPLAVERLQGRSVLCHVLELASDLTPVGNEIMIHARAEDHGRLSELASVTGSRRVIFATGAPRADATILRTDRFYDRSRLRRRVRWGRSPEGAVIWRLDRLETLESADEEITRRLTYQPLGKYWAFPLARALADRLTPTRIRPNALTLASAGLMLSAAGIVCFGSTTASLRAVTAGALALALVLDTADGRLARSQGSSSAFGQWLDQVLDELSDMALHAAIAWSAFRSSGLPVWLLAGMFYASGKYMFVIQSLLGEALERAHGEAARTATGQELESAAGVSPRARTLTLVSRFVRGLGHADLRWHLWIILALLGRLELALAVYAICFPLRALAGAARKAVRYA